MIFLLPGVRFDARAEKFISFCLKLKLWSEPKIEHARFTGMLLIQLFWFMVAVLGIVFLSSIEILALSLALLDILLRSKGIKSSYFFIPIWALALGLGLLVFLGDRNLL